MGRGRGLLLGLAVSIFAACAGPPAAEVPPPPTPARAETATPVATVEPTMGPTAVVVAPTAASPSPVAVAAASPEPSPEAGAVSGRVRVARTGGQGANLRQEPGSRGRVLRILRDGTELTIVGPDRLVDGQAWANVRAADGTVGWMIAEVLEPLAEPTATPIPEPTATPAPTPTPDPAEAAAPCQAGQIKGEAESGLYFLPSHPEYGQIRDRVRCFQSEAQARASGYQPAPEE